jgi:acyl-CoA thioester hydrolase
LTKSVLSKNDLPDNYHYYYTHRVRYAEVDPQEIVFNSRYLEFCDSAGTEYFRALGFPPRELAGVHHFDMVVVRAEVEFLAPARLDDLLHIYVRSSHLGRSSMTTQFEIRRAEDKALLTRVEIKYVNLDRATGKAAPVPASVREAVAAFEGKVAAR